MKNVIVYGAGIFGNRLVKRISSYYSNEIKVYSIVDAHKEGMLGGYRISKVDTLGDSDYPVVIAIENRNVVNDVYSRIREMGDRHFYVYLGRTNPYYEGDSFFEAECLDLTQFSKTIIPHIEVHAVDHCNLNCKACIHYSALFSEKDLDRDAVYNDMEMLSKITKDVMSFYIMGGEPLLRDDICDIATSARDRFPRSDIQILTNGILVSEELTELWDVMRRNNITLTISEYEPLRDHFDKIKDILVKNRVFFVHRPYSKKDRFIKTLCISSESSYENTCICDGCINIYKGKIARCPAVMYLDKLNETFGLTLPRSGIYDMSGFVDASSIVRKMRERIPLCDHCIRYEIEWEQCKKDRCVEDFVVME